MSTSGAAVDRPSGYTPDLAYWSGEAEAEARRVLAETEPDTLYTRHGLQSAHSEDTFALAEALAAFVALPLEPGL